MSYKSLCVVITDWGDLRDQIFSRTGFAPSEAPRRSRTLQQTVRPDQKAAAPRAEAS